MYRYRIQCPYNNVSGNCANDPLPSCFYRNIIISSSSIWIRIIIFKKHIANKTYKKYSTKTLLKRLCEHTNISIKTKQYLINLKNSIDLYELNRNIKYYQIKLDKAYSYKRSSL